MRLMVFFLFQLWIVIMKFLCIPLLLWLIQRQIFFRYPSELKHVEYIKYKSPMKVSTFRKQHCKSIFFDENLLSIGSIKMVNAFLRSVPPYLIPEFFANFINAFADIFRYF